MNQTLCGEREKAGLAHSILKPESQPYRMEVPLYNCDYMRYS